MSPLQDVILNNIGLKGVFECDVSKGGLKAEWLRNDKAIRRGDKYEMQVSDGNHKLVVNDAQFDDVAEYSIKFDGAQSSAKLKINGTCCVVFCLFKFFLLLLDFEHDIALSDEQDPIVILTAVHI